MGMAAALKLRPLLTNVATILAIELLVAAQALDFLQPLRSGRLAEKAKSLVRGVSPPLTADRRLDRDIVRVKRRVEAGDFARLVEQTA
jgi:histidine ammonia-lyase